MHRPFPSQGDYAELSVDTGRAVEDDRREAREHMLDAYPSLKAMYSADDGNTVVFRLTNCTAVFSSFTKEPETIQFM